MEYSFSRDIKGLTAKEVETQLLQYENIHL
jgi:hypothetical protein